MGIIQKVTKPFVDLTVITYDFGLFILNVLSPALKEGHVVPEHAPGHNLTWPEFVPPTEGDSRSACPMLNALANHGILPHDGKNISFKELNVAVRQSFNFASSFCFFAPAFAANFLNRPYSSGKFDLAELSQHNAIEHDGSLTRADAALVPDQGKPDLKLVADLLKEATGKMPDGTARLTKEDLSRALSKRRFDSKRTNKDYSESLFHNLFGSANSSTMLTIFGGSVSDLTPMLTDERFPEKWEPRVHYRYGLTMAQFNALVIQVERGIDVKKIEKDL